MKSYDDRSTEYNITVGVTRQVTKQEVPIMAQVAKDGSCRFLLQKDDEQLSVKLTNEEALDFIKGVNERLLHWQLMASQGAL